jgi:NitT/TauT family transport system permease protein
MRRSEITIAQLVILAMVLGAWELVGRTSVSAAFFVGTPSAAALDLLTMIQSQQFLYHFGTTGFEAAVGLVIGTTVGSIVGLVLWYSDRAARVLKPYIFVLGTVPILALAPLVIVWFGVGVQMKIALAAFSTVFVAFNQAYHGANLVSVEYVDVLRGMRATRRQIFSKVIVPGSFDWVLSSMRLNIGFGLLGAFIGEFISADRGLGYLILRASALYDVPRAVAAAVGIAILALIFDALARFVEQHRHFVSQLVSVPSSIR